MTISSKVTAAFDTAIESETNDLQEQEDDQFLKLDLMKRQ